MLLLRTGLLHSLREFLRIPSRELGNRFETALGHPRLLFDLERKHTRRIVKE
ncbi:hypothetical protein [Sphingobacterium luzhongxinii]|uniref:hypothetical protein n=1 Tax=Sphingobacterium luzhongxinii TaxID=2654181 RepID=UPI00196A0050|nr:hypothetical protein [Sphingobacterium sp. xlx-73]